MIIHIARGWWIAAWVVLLLTFVGGLLFGRKGKPEGFVLAGLALAWLLLVTPAAGDF